MADEAVWAKLYSELLNRNSEIECIRCNELVRVIEKASGEISSLKLIIQMSNDCKTLGNASSAVPNLTTLSIPAHFKVNSLSSCGAWPNDSSNISEPFGINKELSVINQAAVPAANKYISLTNMRDDSRQLTGKAAVKSQEPRDQDNNTTYIP